MDDDARRLMQALDVFEICGPDHHQFIDRLMRQERWTLSRAACTIVEYKKFLLLKLLYDGQVSPSRSVDKVWHLHLLYTVDYWEALCRDTLGRAMHHRPVNAPPADMVTLEGQYRTTLRLYRELFGTDPPETIWREHGPNNRTDSLLRKIWLFVFLAGSFISIYKLSLFLVPPGNYADLVFGVLAIVAVAGRIVLLSRLRDARAGPMADVNGLSIYDLALLFKGPRHAAFTTAVSLIAHGYAQVRPPRQIVRMAPVPEDAPEWLRAADRALAVGPCRLEDIERRLSPLAARSAARAPDLGLELADGGMTTAEMLTFIFVAALLPAVALAWQGSGDAGAIIFVFATFALIITADPGPLTNAKRLHASLLRRFENRAVLNGTAVPPGDLVIAVSLFGGTVLEGTPLWELTKAFNQDRINAESCG